MHPECDPEVVAPAREDLVCPNMKSVTLQKILRSLETMETKISVPEAIRDKAALALEKMIEYDASDIYERKGEQIWDM